MLGIDPGTLATGYGFVAREGGVLRMLACGTIRNTPSRSMPLRLQKIYRSLTGLIGTHLPDECAVETAFTGKNAQSALKLGHARGVAILAAVEQELPTTEYSPREVKKAVVGKGNAGKEQVQYMVRSILRLQGQIPPYDASDALAVALCHLQRLERPAVKFRDWKSFIEANPRRVRT